MAESTHIPAHVGIIMDGNRRWARAQGKKTLEGHQQGSEVFRKIALDAFDRGIKFVSAYVFSTENWSRTEEEVGYLMKLVVKSTEKYLDTFHKAGVRIVILGRRTGLDQKVLKAIEKAEAKTRDNTRGTLALCFNYGGREELIDAAKKIVAEGTPPQDITPEVLQGALYGPDIPDIDLVIRTSGEKRLSGYMLYRAAYAELHFTDKFWPDFTSSDLDLALEDYAARQRRFGS